ncbi:unnamed protein product (macronuclear) [Paramecium tetraurelia]|uniref:U1-type domain-containing protein n=1 Tax=Paramecium tetraurelia TaxID=5888 RepID=A0CQI9_PARTE|nr:uncharacterized protein GSPATT00009404001 [Paramecium tetraurelia]CAK73056.1 unnamed protein product [Paramecium tetraurelia]|eukprot:XP_001440453.1 hypothetical protein (macronuclear) [Paramecium tetraurelia strain d4-2]
MSNQDELKRLMEEKRRQKVSQVELPKNAQLMDGKIICVECESINETLTDFKRHLIGQRHKDALQVLKRNAQIDVNRLENEAFREEKMKKQKLTKQQIDRINKEVDQEFAEIEQITYEKKNQNELPEDFFDQIEVETKIQQQLQEEQLKKIKQQNEVVDEDIDILNEKQDIQKRRERILKNRSLKQKKVELEFNEDGPLETDFQLNWKQKGNN